MADAVSKVAPWILGAQIVVTELDLATVGASPLVDAAYAPLVQAPLLLGPVVWLGFRSASVRHSIDLRPQRGALLWLGWGILTLLWSVDPLESAKVSLASLGLWLSVAWFVTTFGYERFSRVFVVSASVFMTGSLAKELMVSVETGRVDRMQGLSFAPPSLGRLSLVVVLVAALRLFENRRDRIAQLALVLGAVMLAGSGTRTTFLVCVACVAFIFHRRAGLLRISALTVALVLISLPVFSAARTSESDLGRIGQTDDVASVNGRTVVWDAAIDLIAERPLAGHGVATGPVVLAIGDTGWEAGHAHQLGLELLMTEGLVGLGLFALAVVGYFRTRERRASPMAVLIIAFLLNGLTEAMVNRPNAAMVVVAAAFAERSAPHVGIGHLPRRRDVVSGRRRP